MSKRQPVKKYVVLIAGQTEGDEKKNFRSIPMTHAAAMSEIADLKRDGIIAGFEEDNEEDLKPIQIAKQRLKERKERKKLNDALRLFSEEWFTKYE